MVRRLALCAVAIVCFACGEKKHDAKPVAKVVDAGPPPEPKVELPAARELPKGKLAAVEAPADNPLTAEKAELGWMLFFEKRLSKDGSKACADCHHPDKAYTSGEALDAKVGGAMNKRNAQSMVNLGYAKSWYWDGRSATLEAVSLAAWKGQLGAEPAEAAAALAKNATYKALFQRAFKADPSADNVPMALASFFRSLGSAETAWDKYEAGDKKAVSADAIKGFAAFKKRGCVTCHVAGAFSDFDFHRMAATPTADGDQGQKDSTHADGDAGKFKTPSLLNVALTAPYQHDGSAKTLDEAIDRMAGTGVKKKIPGLDPKLKFFKLAPKERAQLKAFLETLSSTPTWATAPEKLP